MIFGLDFVFLTVAFLTLVEGVSIRIGGSVNIGPDWKYQERLPLAQSNTAVTHPTRYIKVGSKEHDNLKYNDYKGNANKRSQKKVNKTKPPSVVNENRNDPENKKSRIKINGIKTPSIVDDSPAVHEYKKSVKKESQNEPPSDSWKKPRNKKPEIKIARIKSESNNDNDSKLEYNNSGSKIETEQNNFPKVRFVDSTDDEKQIKNIKKSVEDVEDTQIFIDPKSLKNDAKINEFNAHIYKQALKVIDKIRLKTADSYFKNKLDFVSKNYKTKFLEYLNATSNHKIKTRVGLKKLILNTIDTSHRIIERLVNHLVAKLDRHGSLKNGFISSSVIKKEIDADKQLEYKHVCIKFDICRTTRGFTDFFLKLLTELLRNDDTKLKKATDTVAEIVTDLDLEEWMKKSSIVTLRYLLNDVKHSKVSEIRTALFLLKKVLTFRNLPLNIFEDVWPSVVKRTVAFLDLMDIFDEVIPSNEENTLSWGDILNSIREWSEDGRGDIADIFKELWAHIKKKGLRKLDSTGKTRLSQDLFVLLSVGRSSEVHY